MRYWKSRVWASHAVAAPLADLDDDVAELLDVDEPAEGVDGELEALTSRHGLLADLPGGDLQTSR
jgi:hypothetical protein